TRPSLSLSRPSLHWAVPAVTLPPKPVLPAVPEVPPEPITTVPPPEPTLPPFADRPPEPGPPLPPDCPAPSGEPPSGPVPPVEAPPRVEPPQPAITRQNTETKEHADARFMSYPPFGPLSVEDAQNLIHSGKITSGYICCQTPRGSSLSEMTALATRSSVRGRPT